MSERTHQESGNDFAPPKFNKNAGAGDILLELQRLNKLLKLNNTLQLIGGHGFPRSRYWTWFQKSLSNTLTVQVNQTITLVQSSDLPSQYGWFHSADLSCSSGLLAINATTSSPFGGGQTQVAGTLQNFWSAGFNPRANLPGDPVVIKTALDEPATFPAQPEWKIRTSPNMFIPYANPFSFKITNQDTAVITVYTADLYFLCLTKDFTDLIDKAEADDLIYNAANH